MGKRIFRSYEERQRIVDEMTKMIKAGAQVNEASAKMGVPKNAYYAWQKIIKRETGKAKTRVSSKPKRRSKVEAFTMEVPQSSDKFIFVMGSSQDRAWMTALAQKLGV